MSFRVFSIHATVFIIGSGLGILCGCRLWENFFANFNQNLFNELPIQMQYLVLRFNHLF